MAANGVAFGLAAQANFLLSAHVTWRDRNPHRARPAGYGTWRARWARFNTVAIAALAVNEAVFTIGVRAGVQLLLASCADILAGAVFTFTLNNPVTFRDQTARKTVRGQLEHRPGLTEISGRAQQDGVAFFLPAFNEAANLRAAKSGDSMLRRSLMRTWTPNGRGWSPLMSPVRLLSRPWLSTALFPLRACGCSVPG